MELWIRSTARTNLIKTRFLTIMEGKELYHKSDWEYNGYTIADVSESGHYCLLGTYKTEERALEVLEEIQNLLKPKIILRKGKITGCVDDTIFREPDGYDIKELSTYVYEMPKE